MNANYRRGARAEYRTKKILEATGHWAMRAAGSHGLFDIVAVSALGTRFIQCKVGSARVTPTEREAMQTLPRPKNSTVEIWTWKPRMREPLIERVG